MTDPGSCPFEVPPGFSVDLSPGLAADLSAGFTPAARTSTFTSRVIVVRPMTPCRTYSVPGVARVLAWIMRVLEPSRWVRPRTAVR